jgi:cephalosporin hydroxylase
MGQRWAMAWADIRGWFDFEATYDQAIAEAGPDDTLVEVGVAYGKSLAYLARRAIDAGCKARILGVDPWAQPWGDEFQEFVKGAGSPFEAFTIEMDTKAPEEMKRVAVWQVTSTVGATLFASSGWRASMVWIDAIHDYANVKADIAAWFPHVRRGGFIGGHDHTDSYPGVAEAVREAFPLGYEVRGSSWFVRVP